MFDYAKIQEIKEKEKRIFDYMANNNVEAMIIGRQDNFAWLSSGGRNYIAATSDLGAALVVITLKRKYLIANTMDGMRILEEELHGLDYDLISLNWYEKSLIETAEDIIKGKKAISDIMMPGAEFNLQAIYDLHYPLTSSEVSRYRKIAVEAETILKKVADEIKPGMSEKDAEALLSIEYAKSDFFSAVILIGSDERIEKFRHPVPTNKKIQNIVMLAPAPRKCGLFIPITRMIYFGDKLPCELEKKYNTLLNFEANVFANCIEGASFAEIFETQQELYKNSEYSEEWREHFMGGLTGYFPNDPTQYSNPIAKVKQSQIFNWYLTITGAKVEEVLLTTKEGNELLSVNGAWPTKKIEIYGKEYELPNILIK
jgi:hypothetical protein